VVQSFHGVIEQRIEGLANDVKRAIGAPVGQRTNATGGANVNSSLGFQQGAGDGLGSAPRAD
jgi:hypothetical protein